MDKTFREFRDGDETYRQLAAESIRLCDKRFELPADSSRARQKTVDVAWGRAAEARDTRQRELRAIYDNGGR